MKKNLIYFLLSFSVLSFSACDKSDDSKPIAGSGSKEHYMPISVGNSWTYNSDYFGKYTVSVTGKKEMNSKEYFILTNSLSPLAESYMRYDGNKLYNYSSVNGSLAELLFIDEDATEGQEWLAGKIDQSQPALYSYSIKYTGKFVKFHEKYTFNGKAYTNVKEINLKTTIEGFELGSYYTSLLSPDELEATKTEYLSSLQSTAINQTQFFAKGIGYVNQTSANMPLLNVELTDYTIK